jgi:hypothetical protein
LRGCAMTSRERIELIDGLAGRGAGRRLGPAAAEAASDSESGRRARPRVPALVHYPVTDT